MGWVWLARLCFGRSTNTGPLGFTKPSFVLASNRSLSRMFRTSKVRHESMGQTHLPLTVGVCKDNQNHFLVLGYANVRLGAWIRPKIINHYMCKPIYTHLRWICIFQGQLWSLWSLGKLLCRQPATPNYHDALVLVWAVVVGRHPQTALDHSFARLWILCRVVYSCTPFFLYFGRILLQGFFVLCWEAHVIVSTAICKWAF